MMRLLLLVAAVTLPVCAEQPEVILQQAVEAHQRGDFDNAIQSYRAFLKLRPGSLEAHSNLGAVLAHQGSFEEAISEYRAALKLAPRNPGVALNLALAYYKSEDIRRAAAELEQLNSLTPGVPQVMLLLADCRLRLGDNEKVIGLLSPIAKDEHADLGIAYLLGTALIRERQMIRGQLLLDRILKNGDSAEARLLMGTAKLGSFDYAGALEELTRAVQLNPKLPSVNSFYGQALMSTGDTAGAAKAFRAELAQNPTDFDSNLNLASLLRQDQDYAGAKPLLDRALRIRQGDIRVRYQLATIHLAEGDTELARKELEAMLKEAPKFTEAHVSLATVYYRLKMRAEGDRERALVLKLNADAQAAQPKGDTVEAAKPQ